MKQVLNMEIAMKAAVKILLLIMVGVMGANSKASEANYFRVWQGFKKASLTSDQFLAELPTFMQDTVNLYEGRGLNNYLVVIPPDNSPSYIPEELALVALTSEAAYQKIRATEEGKKYGQRHWDVFNKDNSASSKHFIDYQTAQPEKLNSDWTYDMIGEPVDWSTGYSAVYIGTRQSHLSKEQFLKRLDGHINLAKETLNPLGMRAYIVLANDNYEVAYINWESRQAHDEAFAREDAQAVFADAATMLDPLMYQQLRPFAAGSTIQKGSAYSTLYNGEAVDQKAVIVVTSHDDLANTGKKTGYYLPEVTHPFYALQDSGVHVDIASIKGGKAPMDESSKDLEDELNKRFLAENAALLEKTFELKNLDSNDYSAILFAGGHGTMWDFPGNEAVNLISRQIFEKGGVISAVCHGPAALLGIELSSGQLLIAGKNVTGFTNQEEIAVELDKVMPFALETELINSGANFIGKENWANNVVVDGRLVTGQNPASAFDVGQAVAKLLKN
jgi:putative intracellular protease/amidase